MRFDVISLFPEMFSVVRDQGVSGRAHHKGLWSLQAWNPRDFTHDAHRTVDDRPYGGGPGMVMMAEPLERSVAAARQARESAGQGDAAQPGDASSSSAASAAPVVLLSPTGRRFDQRMALDWARGPGAILICGRYEGVDQRFIQRCVTDEVSLGDFVLSGGEIAALAIIDSVIRLLPGVLNDAQSAQQDSFSDDLTGLLDCPHYTRPEIHEGAPVPTELLSGHHAQIARWRRNQSLALTRQRRPDLIEKARAASRLSKEDERFLAGL